MERVYNFSAGPGVLPEAVLRQAADEMLVHGSDGMSVMEMSHRSGMYESIIQGCEELLRKLMGIPDNYKVLFLQGGASTQFAMVPLNLMTKSGKMDIILTGMWAKKAYAEAQKYGDCKVVASSADATFNYIPTWDEKDFTKDADYFHICHNNTIYGTRFTKLPETGSVPLVCDMSSSILSEPVDVSKFGVIFAGAQKNMGPAGLTVVIIREDLIGEPQEGTPTMLRYDTHANNGSMYNTPPTYAIYICKLVLEWLERMGGIPAMYEVNQKKAGLFYDFLDHSKLFHPTVQGENRSLMNIPFVTGDQAVDKAFLDAAAKAGFVNLKGHRSVGGMRASIYNAMPMEGVEKLVQFMKAFEQGR